MLIRTQTGGDPVAVPLATMAEAVQLGSGKWRIETSRGEHHYFSDIDWQLALELTPTATLPALPGTYLISADEENPTEASIWRTNVVGWLVCLDQVVRPAVVDREGAGTERTVLHPDGRVEAHGGGAWNSITEWLEHLRDQATARQAR